MPKATPDANKSDKPPSMGMPGGGGLLASSGLGGSILAYVTKLKSIKLKHNIIILIFFLFIFGVEYAANLIKL